MVDEPLSEHCSLMRHPERSVLPSDCPKDATYIRTGDEGGSYQLRPITPFPIVIEGGSGDDNVTVVGTPRNPVMIDGGKGNDHTTVVGASGNPVADAPQESGLIFHSEETQGVEQPGTQEIEQLVPAGINFLGALLIVFATIGVICWRALKGAQR